MNVSTEAAIMWDVSITQRFLAGIFGSERAVAGCVKLMKWFFWVMVRLGFAPKEAGILAVPHLSLTGITPQNTFGIVRKFFSARVVKRLSNG